MRNVLSEAAGEATATSPLRVPHGVMISTRPIPDVDSQVEAVEAAVYDVAELAERALHLGQKLLAPSDADTALVARQKQRLVRLLHRSARKSLKARAAAADLAVRWHGYV